MLGLALLFFLSGPVDWARAAPGLTVETPGGQYQGRMNKGARLFPNIAYGKPPVGLSRWRRTALEERAIQRASPVSCPQTLIDTFPVDPTDMDEDCLYLNVWAPPEGEKHPVVFFIHGGAYITGTGLKSFYDGSVFTRRGIVFVAINYRLGDLGYGPRLSKEPGSPGLMDQGIALQWVVHNIERFGGDPHRIFLMGQSKGAEADTALIESGLADDHVAGAIAFSGPRHFEPNHNDFLKMIPREFLPGEPFMDWRQFMPEQGFRLIIPELPAVRERAEGGHRFKVLVSGIHDEHTGAIFCYNLYFLLNAYDYIDSYFYVLHPGTVDHGSELKSLFAEDVYGRRLMDHLVHFMETGSPPNPHFFGGAVKPFRESREIIHLYPKFTLTETYDQPEYNPEQCPGKMAELRFRVKKFEWLEALSRKLGGGSQQPDFDPLISVRGP